MRYRSDFRSSSRENYKAFCELHKSVDITYDVFKQVIYSYADEIGEYCLSSGDSFALPRGFGKIGVNRKQTVSTFTDKKGKIHTILPVNWPESKKTGKKQYYYNDHTEGWKFRWLWFSNSSVNLKMKEIWEFKPARKWSTRLFESVTAPGVQLYKYPQYLLGRNKVNKKK